MNLRGEQIEPEAYLGIAVSEWLPHRSEGANYERVLTTLAERFVQKHRDSWLRDVLGSQRTGGGDRGLAALAAAIQANSADDSEAALRKAAEATRELQSTGNAAAALRADYEQSYALHRTVQSAAECVPKAAAVERRASASLYAWLAAAAALEQGNCRSLTGESGQAFSDMTRAREAAHRAGYDRLEFQAACVLWEMQADNGNLLAVWNFGRDALVQYWSGAYSAHRVH